MKQFKMYGQGEPDEGRAADDFQGMEREVLARRKGAR